MSIKTPVLTDGQNTQSKVCSKCSKPMVMRKGARGKFYGCSGYPRCKGTQPYRAEIVVPDANRQIGTPQGITLTPQQLEIHGAIASGSRHIVVDARAGCSKTTTLTWALPLIQSGQRVAFCAFNKSIATELQSRVPDGVRAMTLHSLGYEALREGARESGSRVNVDADKVEKIFNSILELQRGALGLEDKDHAYWLKNAVRRLVSLCKATLTAGTDMRAIDALASRYNVDVAPASGKGIPSSEVYRIVGETLFISNSDNSTVDMDDMIYLPAIGRGIMPEFDTLLVDESQDLNFAQQKMVFRACPEGRIVLTGDKFQAIYGFRAADAQSMSNMTNALATTSRGVTPLKLTYTNRCPKAHVDIVRSLVPDIEAAPGAPAGSVEFVGSDASSKMKPGDMAICRVNADLIKVAYELISAKIPCVVRGRDIGAGIISLISNLGGANLQELLNNLGTWHREQVERVNRKSGGTSKRLAAISSLDDRRDTLEALIEGAVAEKQDIDGLKATITRLFSDSDDVADRVMLSSVHRAKGLESERVFILRPDLMPHPMANGAEELQQEKNIAYVAFTRSKSELFVCGALPAIFGGNDDNGA